MSIAELTQTAATQPYQRELICEGFASQPDIQNYPPKWARALGSIESAVLLQQIIAWYLNPYKGHEPYTPFFKKMKGKDVPGDSWEQWADEHGFNTFNSFRSALRKIATKTTVSGKRREGGKERLHVRLGIDEICQHTIAEFNDNGRMENAHYLIWYAQDSKGTCHFGVNENLFYDFLKKINAEKPLTASPTQDNTQQNQITDKQTKKAQQPQIILPKNVTDCIKQFQQNHPFWSEFSLDELIQMAHKQFNGKRPPRCLMTQVDEALNQPQLTLKPAPTSAPKKAKASKNKRTQPTSPAMQTAWDKFKQFLKQQVEPLFYQKWILPLDFIMRDDNAVIVLCNNRFVHESVITCKNLVDKEINSAFKIYAQLMPSTVVYKIGTKGDYQNE